VLEDCWLQVAMVHPSLPGAVFTIGSGELPRGRGVRLGRFTACSWQTPSEQLPEVFIGAEGLARGPEAILATLLHEAAHGLADAAGIQDTSRGRRYHNRRYRGLAENVGPAVTHHPQLGWSLTRLTDHTMNDPHLYIVEVDDQCDQRLAGHAGCSYISPPQPRSKRSHSSVRSSATTSSRFPSSTRPGARRSPVAGVLFACTALRPTASFSSKHATVRSVGSLRCAGCHAA
jgi:hypothetical protein